MAAGVMVTGPAKIMVAGAELGTCERAPHIQILHEWDDIMNACGGVKIPYERAFQGDHVIARCDLTRWDPGVYSGMKSYGNQAGGLMFGNSLFDSVVINFTLSNGSLTMPYTVLDGPDDLDDACTTAFKLGIILHAYPLWTVNAQFTSYTLA